MLGHHLWVHFDVRALAAGALAGAGALAVAAVTDDAPETELLVAVALCASPVYGRRESTWQAASFRGLETRDPAPVSVDLAHIFRLHEGKIVEHWAVRDDLGIMQQLGVIRPTT